MAKRNINIGATANDRSGDLIRTAFQKVNDNFTELYAGLPLLSVGPLPPDGPHTTGEQWWDSTDGNSYIWYDGNWVPSTASVADQAKNVRQNFGNSVNIDFQADGIITTALSSDITVAFSNYIQGARVRVIVSTDSNSRYVTLGVPAGRSSNGSVRAQASTVPSVITLDYICAGDTVNDVYVTVNDSADGIPPSGGGLPDYLDVNRTILNGNKVIFKATDSTVDSLFIGGTDQFLSIDKFGAVALQARVDSQMPVILQGASSTLVNTQTPITDVSLADPVVITVVDHALNDNDKVYINGFTSCVELNSTSYYVYVLDADSFELYLDRDLQITIDGTGFTAFAGPDTGTITSAPEGGDIYINAGANSTGTNVGDSGIVNIYGQNVNTSADRTVSVVAGSYEWDFTNDGKLHLPLGGDIVDSNGDSVLGGTGGGISISDFGRGFTDTLDAGKITTSKLYNRPANLALNNHFVLEVTDGGVVVLPDQSIINGATLKTVPGNYAALMAGPVGKDEDSQMWVDPDGAWIATKYSTDQFTWKFDNNGALILPGTQTITDDAGDLVITNPNLRAGVSIGVHDPSETPTHWYFASNGQFNFPSGAGFARGDNGQLKTNDGATLSLDFRDTGGRGFYTNGDGFSLRSNGSNTWKFDTDGALTVPGDIKSAAGVGPVVIEANNGTLRTWTFGGDGNLTAPGNILMSNISGIYSTTAGYTVGLRMSNTEPSVKLVAHNHEWQFNSNGVLKFPIAYASEPTITMAESANLLIQGYKASGFSENGGNVIVSGGSAGDGGNNGNANIFGQQVTVQTQLSTDLGSPTYSWTFGTDGLLTFPGAEGFQATFGSVEPVGDVLHSVNNLHLESEQSVTVNSGNQVADLENTWLIAEQMWVDIRDEDAQINLSPPRPWAGLPSYEAYPIILNYQPTGGQLPPPGNMAPVAKTASDAYDFWQEELTASGVNISVAGSNVWNFSGDGALTFPNTLGSANSQIYTTNGGYQTVFETFNDGTGRGSGQKLTLDYDDAAVKIQSQAGTEWKFDQAGTTTFPGGYLKIVADGANPYISNRTDNGLGLVAGSAIQIRQSTADNWGITINSSTTDTSLGGGAELAIGTNIDVNGTRIVLGQYTVNNIDANTGLTSQNKIEINNDAILIGQYVSTLTSGTTTSAFSGWTFGNTGTLTFPDNGKITTGADTAQVGSTLTIATDSEEGTGSGTPNVVDVPFDGALYTAYPAGSTITFANGDVRTITSIAQGNVGLYLNLSYSGTATTSSPEFPIILKTANYAAATTAPEWQFGTDGALTLPTGGTVSYTPATSTDWSGTPPTTMQEAIDRLAAAFKQLNNGTGA